MHVYRVTIRHMQHQCYGIFHHHKRWGIIAVEIIQVCTLDAAPAKQFAFAMLRRLFSSVRGLKCVCGGLAILGCDWRI